MNGEKKRLAYSIFFFFQNFFLRFTFLPSTDTNTSSEFRSKYFFFKKQNNNYQDRSTTLEYQKNMCYIIGKHVTSIEKYLYFSASFKWLFYFAEIPN